MRGDKVIVRAFGDKPLVRRVWDVTDEVVFVTTEGNYKKLLQGAAALWPVGLCRADVFTGDIPVDVEGKSQPLAFWMGLDLYRRKK